MIINSITIKNVRSFNEETTINFKKDLNILIGPNGGGKSNLLDIINICMRRFLLFEYTASTSPNPPYKKSIIRKIPFDPSQLDKFNNNIGDGVIYIKLSLEDTDIANIISIINKASHIESISLNYNDDTYAGVISIIKSWQLKDIQGKEGYSHTFTIFNNNLKPASDTVGKLFQEYLKVLGYLFLFASDIPDFTLHPAFLFLGPYRNVSDSFLSVSLMNSNYYQELNNLYSSTSRDQVSCMRPAAIYFALKKRKYSENPNGWEQLWNEDKEVQVVKKYLEKLDYSFDVNCIDVLANMYSIDLIRENENILLSKSSSGEKEIINFIFGIVSLDIRNGMILIDEPELHLHPKWQKFLLNLLKELGKETNNQFIISTHSTSFIDAESLENIIRIYKDKDGSSKNANLKTESTFNLKETIHIINQTNNEKIFFTELVVLVEGITDRLIFQKIFEEKLKSTKSSLLVEVIDIGGKDSFTRYKDLLNKFKIDWILITDRDYLYDNAPELKDLFCSSYRKVNEKLNDHTYRNNKITLEHLENAYINKDWNQINEQLDFLRNSQRKFRDNLTDKEKGQLWQRIDDFKQDDIYILKDGDIEDYFPNGFKRKGVEKTLELLKEENYKEWKKEEGYKLLAKLADEILESYNNRSVKAIQPEATEVK